MWEYDNNISPIFFIESGSDYSPDVALNITFTAGTVTSSATQCASIGILEDEVIECVHSFTVEAGDIECDVEPAIVSASPSTTVTIEDNDGIVIDYSYCTYITYHLCPKPAI